VSGNFDRVLIVGPNPAMDIVLQLPGFVPGRVHRAVRSLHLAGGKPMIVARTLRRLGIEVCLVSPLGGHLGPRRVMVDECEELGIDLRVCEVRDETRTCVIVADTEAGESSVVNEPGPRLSDKEVADYGSLVTATLSPGDLMLVSGSLPPGLGADFYATLVKGSRTLEVRCIVDTSGEPLERALEASPWAVKVNRDELLAATAASSVDEAARTLATRVEHVVVTLGAEGSLYAGPGGLIRTTPIRVDVANATGAGDAFLAGLAAGLMGGSSWPEALRLATASAALACGRLEPDIGPSPRVNEMTRTVETLRV
jgi:1-phosphofructokinase family hexose kinase